ncbi:MAG: sigma-70 family RNA polymerase sigma factor, partial [Clostridia bacterium]|nr:sigma-70 family RNA polymerase sigma factor [Clostridia bacterium]
DSIPPNRPDSLGGYLIHLVRQISIDRYRKLCSVKRGGGEMTLSLSELEEVISHESGPESELENSLLNKAVAYFFGSLSPEERRLFIARYYYFDPVSRAAHYCGMSVPKAKSMLFRLRRRLREHLEKEGIEI